MLHFIHITDTHIGANEHYRLYRRDPLAAAQRLVEEINALPFEPAFVLHTGDVIFNPSDEAGALAAEVFSKLKYPIYYVAGNHDEVGVLRVHLLGQPRGDERLFYDFQVEGYHFIILDTRGQPDPRGEVSEDQLTWLAQICAASNAKAFVICLHHLPLKMGVPWYDNEMRIMNDAALFEVLRPYRERLRGIFFGHIHRAFTGFREGILCSAAASAFAQIQTWPSDLQPNFDYQTAGGYALVTLAENQVTITHHSITP